MSIAALYPYNKKDNMIPCPKLPIFTYGALSTPHKIIVLPGKIEGSIKAILKGFKLVNQDNQNLLLKTDDKHNAVYGELLWINLEQYDELIQSLDSYGTPSHVDQATYNRISCQVTTNDTSHHNIPSTTVDCWTYQASKKTI